jgi:hypothetical protein
MPYILICLLLAFSAVNAAPPGKNINPIKMDITSSSLLRERMAKKYPQTKATAADPIPAWVTADTRPLLAVGTIKEINFSSQTLRLGIDRKNSRLPNAVKYRAAQAGALDALLAREFPPERLFRVTTGTLTFDARLSHIKPPTPASSGRIDQDAQRLPRSAFKAGDHVSALYRFPRSPGTPPFVMNLSRVDPGQPVRLDFNPMGQRKTMITSTTIATSTTTVTTTTTTSQRR